MNNKKIVSVFTSIPRKGVKFIDRVVLVRSRENWGSESGLFFYSVYRQKEMTMRKDAFKAGYKQLDDSRSSQATFLEHKKPILELCKKFDLLLAVDYETALTSEALAENLFDF